MKSKPKELREAAVKAVIEKKITVNEAIELFQTSRAVIYSWIAVFKKEGRLEAKKSPGRKPIITENVSQKLIELLEKNHDMTLEELREGIGGVVHISTIHKHLAALGYKLKKTLKAEEQQRYDVIQARKQWENFQENTHAEKIVCLDESAAKTNMTRLYGRVKGGKRCFDRAPDGRWKSTTMLSFLRSDGKTECMVYEGGTPRSLFEAFLEKFLCPTLNPGDYVIMDNLSSHKGGRVVELIETYGAKVLYLPPYSPDLNPIEKMWSKIKACLRKIKARTREALYEAINTAFELVTAEDAKNWFISCGYKS